MLLSHVKISSFRAKAHLISHWFLYNIYIYIIKATLTPSGDKDCVDKFSILNNIMVGAGKRDKKFKKDHSTLNDYSRKVGTVDSW